MGLCPWTLQGAQTKFLKIPSFDGQTEFLQVFNFTILSYLQNSLKFDACKKYDRCFTVLQAINAEKRHSHYWHMTATVTLHYW